MRCRSLKPFARIREALILGIVPLTVVSTVARADVTISAVSPLTQATGSIIYAASDPVAPASGGVDTGAGFRAYDLTTSSDSSDIFYLDVKTSKNFGTLSSGQDVVITLVVADRAMPITQVGPLGGVAACTSTTCQASDGTYYYAAKYPTSPAAQTYRIGFYPKLICATLSDVSGACTAGVALDPAVFPIKVYIGIEESDGGRGKIADTEERGSVTVRFQKEGPTRGTCPSDLSSAYFPGDGSISFEPAAFSGVFTVTSAYAPVDTLVVLAADGAAPGAVDASGQITARVSSSSPSVITGFSNTTDGSDHVYVVSVGARNQAGILSGNVCTQVGLPPGVDTYSVQTSQIRGFLVKSQCFIATAAFRSADHPAVMLLRRFRDEILSRSALGQTLIETYYRISPAIAEAVVDHPVLRFPVLTALSPFQFWVWLILHPVVFGALALSIFVFRSRRRFLRSVGMAMVLLCLQSIAWAGDADGASEKSFIDEVREGLPVDPEQSESYIEKRKRNLAPAEEVHFIDELKESLEEQVSSSEGYTQRKKSELGTSQLSGGALESVRRGDSMLEPGKGERKGAAFGFQVSLQQSRAVAAASDAVYRSYASMFGDGFTPDLQFFHEYQPFHSEWLGSLGVFGQTGVSWRTGTGSFEFAPKKPGGTTFATTSSTTIKFVTIPVAGGLVYRFNLLRFLRPYVKAGALALGYAESRSDDAPIKFGYSLGYLAAGGLTFPMDWMNSRGAWSLYEVFGVQRTLLSIDYSRMDTFSGALDFAVSGLALGFVFEI